jgi:hypothetical protein
MSLTFSLRRSLVGVTVLRVRAAAMMHWPNTSLRVALNLAPLIPGVGLAFGLSRWSRAPRVSRVSGLAGIACGWMVAPTLLANPPLDWVQQLLADAVSILLCSNDWIGAVWRSFVARGSVCW